jgi:hypothetical protein
MFQPGSVEEHADWQTPVIHPLDLRDLAGLIIVLQFDPLIRHVAAIKEITNRIRFGGPSGSVHLDQVGRFLHKTCFGRQRQ